ncbi:hypothetical protein FK531_10255 [Rhodococcus spelaei]|uniref:DUF6802 domain-containing protein n=2 Tax=Rhodococcus spelaei TaxID=2546320 RepID=A0A541BAY3_9NOCA|nr:hypothetical protein FK531_10255 [Rhodococcus spelaei]
MGADVGELELRDPTVDLDGDGVLDSRTVTGSAGVAIASDLDGDGFADHVTTVEQDGAYAAWEAHRDPDGTLQWERTDHGRL